MAGAVSLFVRPPAGDSRSVGRARVRPMHGLEFDFSPADASATLADVDVRIRRVAELSRDRRVTTDGPAVRQTSDRDCRCRE
jgi:hypothetical protein